MNVQRVGLTAFRRAAVQPGALFPRGMAASLIQTSKITTITHDQAQAQLASQRLKRPVSPHLSIYRYEQTWFGASAWTRITGAILGAELYGFSLLYLVAPLAGFHIESASIAALFSTFPLLVKGGIKFVLAWPFVYHFMNGMKHLVNDVGLGFANRSISVGYWTVWLGSLAVGFGLAAFW